MQYLIYAAILTVASLVIAVYLLVTGISKAEERNLGLIDERRSTENPAEYIKNLAYHQNASVRRRCRSHLFVYAKKCLNNLRRYHYYLKDIPEKLINLVPASQWLIDNYYVVNREARIVRQSYNNKYCRKTPKIKGGPFDGYPRIYAIAREILKITDFHCDEEDIVKLLNEYQSVKPLTIAELWALPNVIKINLTEKISAISRDVMNSLFIKQRVEKAIEEITSRNSSGTEELIRKLELRLGRADMKNPKYIAHILYLLKELDVDDGYFKQWLSSTHGNTEMDISGIISVEANHQASLQVKMSSAFTSLIEISAINWESVFEKISVVERTLGEDAAGIYKKMDFATKDLYHHEVEKLASELKTEEAEIAKKAMLLSREGVALGNGHVTSHVGFYILGRGKKHLKDVMSYRPGILRKIRDWIFKYKGFLYFTGIAVIVAVLMYIGLSALGSNSLPSLVLTAFFLFIICVTIATEFVNYIISRLSKPTRLPSMNYEKGIPEEYRTIVVMPVILGSERQVNKYLDSMETYYLANKDRNLHFAVLGDFKDSKTEKTPQDEAILRTGLNRIEELNKKYLNDGHKPFIFMNRCRKWNEKQNCWMGWERKRGKLEEFNRLIAEKGETTYNTITCSMELLRSFKFAITIDADTELTKESALKLVGIMAHPLNKPVFNREKTRIIDGYTLLQPRVGIRMHSALSTAFSRTFAGQAGINPYINAISDVYQDNFSEGIFSGKGIYNIRIFDQLMDGTLPENAVLSHDLLEGSYVRCAMVTEVQLMDGYPSSVLSFFKREHRWIRGDWQLLPWILGRDSLGRLSRYKMADNLRRSLIPVSQLGIILMACTGIGLAHWFWIPAVMFSMLFSLIVNIGNTMHMALMQDEAGRLISNIPGAILDILKQGLMLFILIPYRAVISLDAIFRTLHRLTISKRNLLEWQTAEASEKNVSRSLIGHFKKMWACPLAAIITGYSSFWGIPWINWSVALLWFSGSVVSYFISLPGGGKRKRLNDEKINDLRLTARKTWRYFEELFDIRDNWLSPDNYQVSPGNVIAHRTSPTNIGLQLIATLTARDFGYIGAGEMLDRVEKVFSTLDRLEKWNGHFYNWYNTRTLELLYPHYVSTVDSGNLYAYLIVLKNGIIGELSRPLLSPKLFSGLMDTIRLAGNKMTFVCPASVGDWISLLQEITESQAGEQSQSGDQEWSELLRRQCLSIMDDISQFCPDNITEEAPTINFLMGPENAQKEIEEQRIKSEQTVSAKDNASKFEERVQSIIKKIEEYLESMDFRPLYDERRHLFRVGINISAGTYDQSYYDLLASEARLTSFIAIAKGDVPLKHWFKMGRPLTHIHGSTTLISWSGTMFEYLLPNIVMRQVPGTIITQSNNNAVRSQIEYAVLHSVPWGISESAYYRFDMNLNYQYRAFGIPELGFRSDLRKSLVISPYSTMLALPNAPVNAYKNLKTISSIGAEGKYGYYEALDFLTPKARKKTDKTKYKLIQCYMIHHQGMSLAAMNNFLNDDILIERFHKEPMMRGIELVLEESRPVGIIVKKEHNRFVMPRATTFAQKGYDPRIVQTTRPKYPVGHVLSNNNYTSMFTSSGDGFSMWKDYAVNRWKPLVTEHYGMYFYIRDVTARKYWSAGFYPAMVEPDEYSVAFSPDKAEFRRLDGHIETKLQVAVSPQEDVEVRRITISNRSGHTARLDITSYFEPVINSPEADMAHPAFSKLFISTEYHDKGNVLLASRRPTKPGQKRVYLFNSIIVKGRLGGAVEYETDRNRFIGRGRTVTNPSAMETDLPLSNTIGNVLDPVMSLRANISLLPGRTAAISYITGMASSKEKALELALKFQKDYSVEDVFKLALFDSEVEMQYLGLSGRQVNAIQDLVGSVYYPSRLMRGYLDAIEKNRLEQSALWKFGISGDNPIMLFRINNEQQLASLKDAVSAYEYLRKNNVRIDFVILNEERDDYYQPLNQKINDIISSRKIYYPHSRDARIFLLKAGNLTEEELNLLLTVSRIVLSERNRLLSKRVRRQMVEVCPENEAAERNYRIKKYSSQPLQQDELKFFNGLGGFTTDGKEYVVNLTGDQNTPAPWSNVITNGKLGFIITSTGGGYTWTFNSRENKLSEWSNDPVTDPPSEVVYLKDESTGDIFTITPSPIREREQYKIRHGMGYSVFEHNSRGLRQQMDVFLSERDPVKIYKVTIENLSAEDRTLSLYFYVNIVMGVTRSITAPYIITYMGAENVFMARNSYNETYGEEISFIACSGDITSFTGDNTEFIGRTGDLSRPAGLFLSELSNRTGAAFEPCAAIKTQLHLKRKESKEVIFILGECSDAETAILLAQTYTRRQVSSVVYGRSRRYWRKTVEQVQVNTPDEAFNVLMNGWLLYQTLSCRIISRTGFYQSGGAYGFRDQLQDSLAILHSHPEISRQLIVKFCGRQFIEGDVQHWWHDDTGKGIRTKIKDDLLWLPYVTSEYVRSTGDVSVLEECVPFLNERILGENEHEIYTLPSISDQKGSVYEHCIRAIEISLTFGEHGLPFIGTGDWNDGMNSVGDEGRGESVWLAWFLYRVLLDFIEICKLKEDNDRIVRYSSAAEELAKNAEEHGWDGEWYRRAYFDNGEPLGSRQNTECRIDSISQSWSVLSGAANPDRARKAMSSMSRYLLKEEERLLMLLTPPFDRSEPNPGYIMGYLPGIRENGGQYTHGAVWASMAYAKLGMGDEAFRIYNMLNPITHASNYSDIMKYKVEPYVMAADVYSVYPHAGRGGWSWYTGSAGWMYNAGLESILGIKKEGGRLHVNPVIPTYWRYYSVAYKYGTTTYRIDVNNPLGLSRGTVSIMLDGNLTEGASFVLEDDGQDHSVTVTML